MQFFPAVSWFQQLFFGGFTVSQFGPVRNLSRTVPVSDPVPCDSGAVRFRVTRPVAIPICHNGVIYKGFINNLGNFMYKLIFKNKIPKRSS